MQPSAIVSFYKVGGRTVKKEQVQEISRDLFKQADELQKNGDFEKSRELQKEAESLNQQLVLRHPFVEDRLGHRWFVQAGELLGGVGAPNVTGDIDTQVLLQLLQRGEQACQKAKGKSIFVCVGETDTGKSTAVNYLLGHIMKGVVNTERRRIEIYAEQVPEAGDLAEIGHSSISCTLYPSTYTRKDGLTFTDFPGFADNRSVEKEICASISSKRAIDKAKEVKAIALLISYESFNLHRGNPVVEVFQSLKEFLDNPDNHLQSVYFLITKIPEDPRFPPLTVDNVLAKVSDYITDHEKEMKGRGNFKGDEAEAKLKVWKFIRDNPSHLILIDPLNKGNREDIVNTLRDSPNIPTNSFRYSLTPETRHKLEKGLDEAMHEYNQTFEEIDQKLPAEEAKAKEALDKETVALASKKLDVAGAELSVSTHEKSIKSNEEVVQSTVKQIEENTKELQNNAPLKAIDDEIWLDTEKFSVEQRRKKEKLNSDKEEQLDTLKKRKEELSTSLKTLDSQITGREADLNSKNTNISTLRQEIAGIEGTIADYSSNAEICTDTIHGRCTDKGGELKGTYPYQLSRLEEIRCGSGEWAGGRPHIRDNYSDSSRIEGVVEKDGWGKADFAWSVSVFAQKKSVYAKEIVRLQVVKEAKTRDLILRLGEHRKIESVISNAKIQRDGVKKDLRDVEEKKAQVELDYKRDLDALASEETIFNSRMDLLRSKKSGIEEKKKHLSVENKRLEKEKVRLEKEIEGTKKLLVDEKARVARIRGEISKLEDGVKKLTKNLKMVQESIAHTTKKFREENSTGRFNTLLYFVQEYLSGDELKSSTIIESRNKFLANAPKIQKILDPA
ncbi:MAG: hypothetical protein V4591_09190 [Bdellovibrionota bacterium]